MHEEHGEHPVHLPQHSWAPIILGAGIFCINAAFVFGVPFAVAGLLIFVAGIAQWVREDIRKYREETETHG